MWYAENEIGKPAAVKILNEDLSHNAQIVDRFRNEAVVMVKLDHTNIRQVYGYGTIDGRPTIVMEYLDGDDLKALMKQGRRFNNGELVKWWNQLVDALNYTHAQGIVHRDIKPSNIFLDKKGNIKLLDFGIAKIRESISITNTGATLGTLMYMSPEQVDDAKHLGPQSDVYSLAVTFVHLLTGKAPYDSTTMSDFKIRESIVYKPLDFSGVPAEWQDFLTPYLAKEAEKRPALRPFESVSLPGKPEKQSSGGFAIRPTENRDLQSSSDGEGTVAEEKPQPIFGPSTLRQAQGSGASNNKPSTEDRHSGIAPLSPAPKDKPKSKKGLWIGLAVAAVAAIVAIMFLRQPEVVPSSPPSLEPEQNLTGNANGHEWVDLGLPSGTLWATCNVGASNPEDYGNYYAWGETNTKDNYDLSTYQYANGDYDKLTKYCDKSDNGNNGFIDNLTNLQASDDPATTNWGSGWVTPSKAQWNELLENTTNEWTTQSGKAGRLFTSKKNGQTLFLPAAGGRWGSKLYGDGGDYWSSSLYTDGDGPDSAWSFQLYPPGHELTQFFVCDDCFVGRSAREGGLSVRPVRSSRQN